MFKYNTEGYFVFRTMPFCWCWWSICCRLCMQCIKGQH